MICQPMWHGLLHLLHRLLWPLMILVIFYAILVSGFSALTPWARAYKSEIIQYLNEKLEQDIKVDDLKTSWYGLYPVLKLLNVQTIEKNGQTLKCHEFWIGFDLIRTLLYWHIHPGMVYVDGMSLEADEDNNKWRLKGSPHLNQELEVKASALEGLSLVLSFMPEKILLKNIQLAIKPHADKIYVMKDIRFLGQKKAGQYHWSAEAQIGDSGLIRMRLDMPLLSSMELPENGRLYLELSNIHFERMPWHQQLLKDYHLKQLLGQIDGNAWIDWQSKHVKEIHSHFAFKNLKLVDAKKQFQVSDFSGNLLWQKQQTGYELSMDKVHLNLNNHLLMNNKFLMSYQSDWHNYHFYLKEMSLPLLYEFKPYIPSTYLNKLPFFPNGQLNDIQANQKDGQWDYLLFAFNHLSWPSTPNRIGVDGLSGVFNWEPQRIQLQVSSSDLQVKLHHLPSIDFQNVQLVSSYLEQNSGIKRLNINKLLLARQDSALSMIGQIDYPDVAAKRDLKLQINWSLENAEQWLPYLSTFMPANKLRNWLQEDIKKIHQAKGEMQINGLWQDFPFEQEGFKTGNFHVSSYLSGVNLFFAKDWPLNQDIDARLQITGRQLQAIIDKGNLGHLPLSELELRIPDLGLDKEAILVHGRIHAPIKDMLTYLVATPLNEQARNWSRYDFKGQGQLDLKLDIPLGKLRHNDILLRGYLDFPSQALNLDLLARPIPLKQAQGKLEFDMNGLTGGNVAAKLEQDDIHFKVIHQPQSQETSFDIDGKIQTSLLKYVLGVEAFRQLSGKVPFHATLLPPQRTRNFWDMLWESSLRGTKLDLPAPWGKNENTEESLKLKMQYADEKGLDIDVLFHQKNLKMSYDQKVWQMILNEPEFEGKIEYYLQDKLVDVKLSHLYLDASLFSTDKSNPKAWQIQDMPKVKLEVNDFRWNQMALGELYADAFKEEKNYKIEQIKIKSPNYDILMHGLWHHEKGLDLINVNAEMMINRLSKALDQWGVTPAADAKQGYLEFEGRWQQALNQISLKTLSGQLDVNLKKGNITHLDPQTEQKIGLGKLLSILSLQTLPRRLQLDFSDLATKGFAYDIFKGHFVLNQGLLKTNDAVMDGPIALIKMNGGLNVLDRWYDLELQVYPYIAASLPVVASIAGGPLAGVATWAASHVINKGMQQVSAYTYKVTGPWSEPQVQQVSLKRKKQNDATISSNH